MSRPFAVEVPPRVLIVVVIVALAPFCVPWIAMHHGTIRTGIQRMREPRQGRDHQMLQPPLPQSTTQEA